ncbi:MAG: hypothetical protein FH758_00930 [Firmicutes bacterium]|nr:hypothetical protein [Bacillota bacterium]
MEWRGLRLHIIITAFVVGLIIFFGGQFAYNKYNVEKPLEEISTNNTKLNDVEIKENNDGTTEIIVNVQDSTGDLLELYNYVYEEASGVLGNKSFSIKFEDNPDQELLEVWRQSQYIVHQSIMQGNFPEMVDVIKEKAKEQNAEAKIYVDLENVYVQLTKEDGHNLLKIVPRQNFMVTGKVAQVGGEAGVTRN